MAATASPPMTEMSGRRFGYLNGVEVRANDDGSIRVRGHAAVYDTETQIGPPGIGFREKVAYGAFKKTLDDGADVRFLFNHNPDLVLARSKSGTLNMREERGAGLAVEANIAPTSVGRDLAILLERGDVSQMSFGFQVVKDRWETEERDGVQVEVRTILEARLFDVSAVTYPAYDETDLAIREATLTRELRGVHAPEIPERAEPAQATHVTPERTTPEPATATPGEHDERSMPLHAILLRHMGGSHASAPRALCPACVGRSEPEPSTPAA